MRLSWFSGSHGRRQKGRRQKNLKAPTLLVRQLERRRVLDAALTSLATTAVVADVNPAPVTVAPSSTNVPPPTNVADTAQSAAIGSGAILNIPPVLVVATDQNVNEGQQLDLSAQGGAPPLGLYIDPDLGDSHTATVNWGDGSPVQNATVISGFGAGAIGGTHTYADEGTYTVTVSVSDGNGGTDTKSFNVMVANVPPVLVTATDQTVNEGQTLDLSGQGGAPPIGLFVDPGVLDTHTATIDWGDGSPVQNATVFEAGGSGALGGTHTYADDGVYTVKVTVTDDDGGSDSGTFKVTVNNVAPFVDLSGPTMVDEGSSNNWSLGPVVDPGTDTVSQYIVHWGDGNTDTFTAAQIAAMSNTISHTYADGPNNYTISLDLVDEDGTHTAVDTLGVTVKDVAPFVDLTGPTMINEGSVGSWSLGPVVDPGTDTVSQYVIHWGDGSTDTFTSAQIAGMGNAVGHTYADGPNNYTISLDLVDEDGTHTAVDTLDVTVKDVAPFVDLTGPTMVDEGAANTWNLGPVVDPGADTVTQYVIHWGDGNTDTFTAAQIAAMSNNVGHTYADGPNSYTISIDLVNEDGTHLAVDTLDVAVKNVPPFVDLTGPTMVDEGAPNTWMLGAVVDPGTDTVSQYVIHWGDGNTDTFTAAQIAAMSNNVGHTYADGPNNYTITLDLVDEDGTFTAVDTLDVTVKNVAPFVDLTGPTMVNEGAANTWNLGPVIDPGTDTVTQYIVHWGDGNSDTFTSAQIAAMSNNVGHTYADGPNNYTISVDLVDEDGTFTAVDTLDVAVKNVAPFVDLSGPTMVNEGTAGNWTLGPVVDPGTDTVSQYVIHWGDGNTDTFTAAQIAGMANTIGHTYAEGPNNYTISVDLTDEDGTYLAVDTLDVAVKNVAPTVALDAVPDISENGVATLTGTFSDLGVQDAHTVTVSWGDANNAAASTFSVAAIQDTAGMATLHVGDTFNSSTDGAVLTITSITAATGTVGVSVQHQYLDDGLALGNNTASDTSPIGVGVVDDDGDSGSGSSSVIVHNVTPVVALEAVPDISENGTATLTDSYTDIGLLDAHTVTVSWGDANNAANSTFAVGAIENAAGVATLHVGDMISSSTDSAVLTITSINAATGQVGFSVQHQYLDDGLALGNNTTSDTSTIGVTVADDDAQSGSSSTSVVVHNVSPTVALNAVPDVLENGVATLTGSYADIGLLDAHSVTVSWGDANNAANSTFAVGAIENAAGVATLHVGDMISSSTDSAVLTITSINTATGQVGFSVQHQYLDDGLALGNNTVSDTSTIGVTVADDDSQFGSNTTSVIVHNVAPGTLLNAVADISENGIATLTGSYTDIGLLDAHSVTVTWGDPNNNADSTFAVNAIQNAAGAATLHVGDMFSSSTDSAVLTITSIDAVMGKVGFSVQHQYLDDGLALGNNTISDTSTIGVTVADDDGQSGSNTTNVIVHNVSPGVTLNAVPDISENGIATLTGSYTDIGLLDAHTLTVTWGDANNGASSTFAVSAIENAAGTATLHVNDTFSSSTDGAILTITSINAATGQVGFKVQHQYLDDGTSPGNGTVSDTSTIGVTVVDDDTGSGSGTSNVVVHNVAPVITNLSGDSINEGSSATISFSVTDPGTLDVFTVNVDWRDGSTATIGGLGASDVVNGVLGTTTYEWTAATRTLSLSHVYADNADYPAVVRLADDDMAANFGGVADASNFVQQSTLVVVANVPPFLAGTNQITVDEGSAFTLAGLGVHLADFGFDNAANQTAPALGDPLQETFAAYTIDWGDGRGAIPVSIDNVAGRVSGSPGVDTTAQFMHSSYTYADDGTYTVTIRVADDNMGAFSDPSKFVTGTAGVDFVDLTFQITVNNVVPTLAAPVTSLTTINEAHSVNFNVTFTDPGFDNSLNPNPAVQPLIADPKTESFRYFIDWGDGRDQLGAVSAASLIDANGGVGVLSSGSFAGVHNYADDGTYTVTLRIADDNMAAFGSTDKFATGTAGVDFVERTFTVTVHNVIPTIVMPLEGDQVTATGFTKIRLSFNDPGYDNALNPTTPATGSPFQESFTYLVNWGDGTTDTIQVSNVSGTPQVVSLQTAVLTSARTSGSEGVLTTGSFEVQHQYFGPPDPLNPTADIVITVTLQDDNGGTVNQLVKISNPGIQTVNVAIDTTPQVPRLVVGNAQLPPVVLQQNSAAPQSLQSTDARVVRGEVMATSDRYLELVVISPDGTEAEHYRLSDEALLDVRGLFATLPDGRYKVFLVRTDNNSHRLVMDVFVRRGRVIDPQDASEGTRDRPPSSDGAQPNNGQQNGPQQVPLNANPLLKPVQTNGQPEATNDTHRPNEQATNGTVQPIGKMAESEEPVRSRSSMRWAVPLAALGLVASRESWSQRVGAALEKADENAWQRLRRAGRLGQRTPDRRENAGAATNETK